MMKTTHPSCYIAKAFSIKALTISRKKYFSEMSLGQTPHKSLSQATVLTQSNVLACFFWAEGTKQKEANTLVWCQPPTYKNLLFILNTSPMNNVVFLRPNVNGIVPAFYTTLAVILEVVVNANYTINLQSHNECLLPF